MSAHILSWGLPFTEMVTSAFPALIRGGTVIVKPSPRGALSPVAFGFLATAAGLPGGVVNIVQGTGIDVGAAMIGLPGLSALHIRAGERTIAQASRSQRHTGVELRTLRAGGDVMIVTEPLPQRAANRVRQLVAAGGQVRLGGPDLPDDIPHTMGWRILLAMLMFGPPARRPHAPSRRASPPARCSASSPGIGGTTLAGPSPRRGIGQVACVRGPARLCSRRRALRSRRPRTGCRGAVPGSLNGADARLAGRLG